MLMSHFIFQTVRNTSFRLYSRPSSVTDGKQRDRNHPFLTPSMQGSGWDGGWGAGPSRTRRSCA
jgi:hypothetical protein